MKVILNNNSTFNFNAGITLYVDGELQINTLTFNDNSNIVCRAGGKVVICPEAVISGLHTLIVESGGTLEVKDNSTTRMAMNGQIVIRGSMITNQGLNSVFENNVPFSLWEGITFDHTNQLVSPSSISNLTITNAINGITTNYSQPEISNCFFFNNANAGINVIGDTPFLMNNRCENNAYGLAQVRQLTIKKGNTERKR